jgi:hypothetical protein
MTHITTMKLALEALNYHVAQTRPIHQTSEAIAALQAALAEPSEPESGPDLTIAYMSGFADGKKASSKVPEPLSEAQIRAEFAKLYPHDIGILELSEQNRDYAVEAIGARHHWTAFLAGARAIEAAIRGKT